MGPARVLLAWVLLLSGCGLQEHSRAARPRPDAGKKTSDAPPAAPLGDGGTPAAGDPDAAPVEPPPPSGPGVEIDGTFVPRDKALVFIHFGHSNMAGRGVNPVGLRPFFYDPQPHLWSYQGGGQFVPAREPTAPDSLDARNTAGPGMAWLRTAAAAAGPDLHFISVARARTSATTAEFLKGGLYYATFMDRARELKGKVTFAGVFVMMGITDRHMPLGEQGGFADRMAKIIADLRADLGEPDLPVLHSDYEVTSTGSLGIDSEFGRRMRPLILSLPGRITNLVIVPTDAIPLEDDHHFTLEGHKIWVERGVRLLIEHGWFPWQR
jgi:hypothetical protein